LSDFNELRIKVTNNNVLAYTRIMGPEELRQKIAASPPPPSKVKIEIHAAM
jgi:hypothetical protein